MKVAVVTPTIGTNFLDKCIESIQNQTYDDLTHYIFLDGEQHYEKIHPILYKHSGKRTIKTVSLEENVGKGWYGHRVYAACSFLVNADIICYLDEDNWYEPCHVEKIVRTIEKGNDWAYSLRKICDKEGNFLCEDNCESLGKWPVYFNDTTFHIDTSSFGVRRDIAVRIGHAWYGQWGADRQFFGVIKAHFPKFESTKSYTLNYRLDGNPESVNKEFFEKGNEVIKQKYPNVLPWQEDVLQTVGPGISIIT
jgi:glycosyltransferase involved in cell wall biosynthesis